MPSHCVCFMVAAILKFTNQMRRQNATQYCKRIRLWYSAHSLLSYDTVYTDSQASVLQQMWYLHLCFL
jgi:hypothetical protein